MSYALKNEGDHYERKFYDVLIAPRFPAYESFWQKYVALLTNRPLNLHFKSDAELKKIGKGDEQVCIAQLHYTVLRQFIRVYQLLNTPGFEVDHLIFGLSALVGAQDCAFELLGRFVSPGTFDPWLHKREAGRAGSREARESWQKRDGFQLQTIRNYRNSLVHGRTFPGIVIAETGQVLVPKVGLETKYFDWRLVTAGKPLLSDFEPPLNILRGVFDQTILYVEAMWNKELLPKL